MKARICLHYEIVYLIGRSFPVLCLLEPNTKDQKHVQRMDPQLPYNEVLSYQSQRRHITIMISLLAFMLLLSFLFILLLLYDFMI